MTYQLPPYPTNRLEALLHLDKLATTMISQQDNSYHYLTITAALIPYGHILHVGSMVMATLSMLISSNLSTTHYTIIYDNTQPIDQSHITISNHQYTTAFGHHITIHNTNIIPIWLDELCCMIQLYTTITDLTIIHCEQLQHSPLVINQPIIWVGSTIRTGMSLEYSLIEDEKILTQLALGQLDDDAIISYNILHTMIEYYKSQPTTHTLIPISYHNTALIDGQKDSTTGYCAAVII